MRLRSSEVVPNLEMESCQENVLLCRCLCWPSVQSGGCPKRLVGNLHLGFNFFCLSVHCWIGTVREQNLVTAFGCDLPMRTFGWVWGSHGVAGPWPWISSGFSGPTAFPKWPLENDVSQMRKCVCVSVHVCICREDVPQDIQPLRHLAFKMLLNHLHHPLQTCFEHALFAKPYSRWYEECNKIWDLPWPSEVYSLS